MKKKIIVIGAGIFGSMISIILSDTHDVVLVESNSDIMQNASKCNHNRLHFGFHYPRSIETSKQSLYGYESFYYNFKDCICDDFDNYYMIEKNSKVSSKEYSDFCDYLNLYYTLQYPVIDIDLSKIEKSFKTKEPIFDYDILRKNIRDLLNKSNVNLILNKTITNKDELESYDIIINTTYSNINIINDFYNISKTRLRLQNVIIPIFKKEIPRIGLTIMDGDFCSILPKGFEKNIFLLYHVKYSVIESFEGYLTPKNWIYGIEHKNNPFILENIEKIYNESKKYFNFLDSIEHLDYYQTIRALPINEDDSRISEMQIHEIENKKIITLISGKISTCVDIANEINNLI